MFVMIWKPTNIVILIFVDIVWLELIIWVNVATMVFFLKETCLYSILTIMQFSYFIFQNDSFIQQFTFFHNNAWDYLHTAMNYFLNRSYFQFWGVKETIFLPSTIAPVCQLFLLGNLLTIIRLTDISWLILKFHAGQKICIVS